MEEFILKLDELPIFLNVLDYTNNEVFRLYSYIIGKELFNVTLGNEVRIDRLIKKRDYQKVIEDLIEWLDEDSVKKKKAKNEPSKIVPSFKILRRSLIGSGIWKMENWADVEKKLNEIRYRNPLRGDRIAMIGFDTNCFINRIYSCIRHIYKRDISKFGFVLSRIVFSELRSTQKISKNELEHLKNKLNRDLEIFAEFWNQDSLFTRKKNIGFVEFNKLKTQSNYIINDGVVIDNRDNDLQIIEDLRNQTLEKNYDLILISADEQFYRVSREPGINSYYLKNPFLAKMPDRFTGSWEQICDFLYLLSIYFGAISLRAKDTFQLFGIWRSKRTEDWDSESIKIRVGSPRVAQLLKQQINILSRDK
ncbi:MAG: hypothetical protein ACFFD2_06535 [Promethearchaeota archaeon]